MTMSRRLRKTEMSSVMRRTESVSMIHHGQSVVVSSIAADQTQRNFFFRILPVWFMELRGRHVLQSGGDIGVDTTDTTDMYYTWSTKHFIHAHVDSLSVMWQPSHAALRDVKASTSRFWPRSWPRPRVFDLGLECLTSASRFWPRSWPRPQRSGLGLDLGLECLTSASTFWPRSWPRPQRSGLGLDLGLECLTSASRFWPRSWPQPRVFDLGLKVLASVLTSASSVWPSCWVGCYIC